MLIGNNITIGYEKKIVIKGLNLEIKKGEVLSLIGPNGAGKSTILNMIAKQLKISSGNLEFLGKNIANYSYKELAKNMSILKQSNVTLEDITVLELVEYGRSPHKSWDLFLTKDDKKIIEWALKETGTLKFKDRKLLSLSGGERQRVWIAMLLAQKTDFLILDEPTTYLDIYHQLEILELLKRLNENYGLTIFMILHDINQACKYSDKIMLLNSYGKYFYGSPKEVLTEELIENSYGVKVKREVINNIPTFMILGLLENKK